MSNFSQLSLKNVALLALGMSLGIVAPLHISAPSLAQQTTFSDVKPNYWAQPFIQRLTAQNIISGYPDGTFRPEQPLDRDEFAALIQDAFNQNEVRQIPSGSVFKDIPSNYWADAAIEEAYEAGFMKGFPGGFFRPQEEVSRVQALVSLVNGLDSLPARQAASTNQTTTQINTQRAAKKPLFFPLAITSLMQPLVVASKNVQGLSPSSTDPSVAVEQAVTSNRPASFNISEYYTDARQIPGYAVDDVAAATKANIVVNYPNVRVLNPNEPLNRGVAAAWLYQTLVHQGKLSPIPGSLEASNYIVNSASK